MDGLFAQMSFWHWLILGGLLLVMELIVPGVFFLWLGVAAIATAILAAFAPALGWPLTLLAFAALSVVSVILGRYWWRSHEADTDKPLLNQRGRQYVGEVHTLIEPIADGYGKVRIGDSAWVVRGPDLGKGLKVRITGSEGSVLLVEPA